MKLKNAQKLLISVGQEMFSRGWVPATSGNFSIRLNNSDIAITASGKDKGKLSAKDIICIKCNAYKDAVFDTIAKPSEETLLHLQLYNRDNNINAVIHTHSVNSIAISEEYPKGLTFSQLEILKAFSGINTHDTSIYIPVFSNQQNISLLAGEIECYMKDNNQGFAYLIKGHGVYTWGYDINECIQHLEALEYLFEYNQLKK